MGLMDDVGRGPIGIDTAIFIYYIEEHPEYFAPVSALFAALDKNRCQGVTSALTLLETLVVPYRAGDTALPTATSFCSAVVGGSSSSTSTAGYCAPRPASAPRMR
ncbi:MAG: type II toxin-antitoxin system VapC family toxin [Vicinamibacteria bacterium]